MQIFGMEDNFWTTGGPGPGGPCSEIYVDRGPEYGRDGGPAADETRFIEIWDLVFENYEVDHVKSKTDLHIVGELAQKYIDTGAGLERLAYLMQGKQNIYETDEVFPVIEAAERLSGRKNGIEILDVAVKKAKKTADPVVSGSDAFTLHDTYGFPIELTLEMAADQGVKVDEAKFRELMAEQKSRARADALKKRHNVDLSVYDDFKKTLAKPIDFLGYTDMSARAKVIGIMQEGKGSVPAVTGPANVEVILDRTPFYAEAGGQLADQGEILSDDGAVLEVDKLRDNLAVTTKEMKFDDAIALGAMHLFGEKYGDIVRVVSIGEDGWSRELCGGTHVDHVGKIGMVNILSEASIGSGVRRVDAVVGQGAYDFNAREHALVSQLSDKLNARPDELAERVNTLLAKLKESDRRLASMYEAQLAAAVPALVEDAKNSAAPVKVAIKNVGHFGAVDALRKTVLDVRGQLGEDAPAVVALAGVNEDDKPMVAVATNEAARKAGIKAGDLVRGASKILGGGGGGKPDFAQGGGADASKINEALEALKHEAQKA